MNWYKGSIEDAIKISKQKNAIFVVYVEGKDPLSEKMKGFIDDDKIRNKLESENFVAIRIEGGSENYLQFSRIYRIVPLPSLFFIGGNGAPLEIATGAIASVDELEGKVDNALKEAGIAKAPAKNAADTNNFLLQERATTSQIAPAASSNAKEISESAKSDKISETEIAASIKNVDSDDKTSKEDLKSKDISDKLIDEEGKMSKDDKSSVVGETSVKTESKKIEMEQMDVAESVSQGNDEVSKLETPSNAMETNQPKEVSSIGVDTSSKSPDPSANQSVTKESPKVETTTSGPNGEELTSANLAARIEETRKLLEQKRRQRIEEERRLEKEKELTRRKDGKSVKSHHQWQKEQELKELKDSIRRERVEEQEARQRILEKIASDRAERAQKFATPTSAAATPPSDSAVASTSSSSPNVKPQQHFDNAHLNFRISNGISKTNSFQSKDNFEKVRTFVKTELLPGTGIKEFTLATSFPKKEFKTEDDDKTLQELGLCPNAVILVIGKHSNVHSAVSASTGGIVSMFNLIFWTLVSPVVAIFTYFKNSISGNRGGSSTSNSGAQKRANEDQPNRNDLTKRFNSGKSASKAGNSTNIDQPSEAYRRLVTGSNIHRLSDNQDSDDENATWNGNSTQQQ